MGCLEQGWSPSGGEVVYVFSTYRDMNPYFKGVHLTLDIWRPYGDEEGWMLRGEEFKWLRWEVSGKG